METVPVPRHLLKKMLLAGLVLALLVSLLTVMAELEWIDEELSSAAIALAEQAHRQMPAGLDRLEEPQREAWMKDFLIRQAQPGTNHFIFMELYNNVREEIGNAGIADISGLKAELDRGRHLFAWRDKADYRRIWKDGNLYLQVWVSLKGQTADDFSGYLEGVFRVSPENLRGLYMRVALAVAFVVSAILLAVIIVYPVVRRQHERILDHAREVTQSNIDLLRVLGNAIAKRDSDTHAHNYRVTLYSIWLAEARGLAHDTIRALIKGAFLHDVGKIAIPDKILHKPGPLDEEEFRIMKTHPAHGKDIVESNPWLAEAVDVVWGHHEKFDGSGYPQGLKGKAIPVNARIFCIADVFDALTSRRPYKEPFPFDKSVAILQEGRGRHFDPELLDLFLVHARKWYQTIQRMKDNELHGAIRTKMTEYFN
ncbi:HD-GYP domain-containing protein [Hahella sp. SMD15-11]|uniref:HD-GYP domain-containing protein n=1 Tax=Thermohahella caldifontis TaxID=3142973 RepID=A0AB39USV1_9GAMM